MRFLLPCLILASIAALGGCPDRTVAEIPPTGTAEIQKDIPVSTAIDLLFVIDNSKSTRDKQDLFAANFRNLVDALDRFPGGRPNLHIGVVSTSVDLGMTIDTCPSPMNADNGLLHNTPFDASCTGPNGRFIIDNEKPGGGREINYIDDPGDPNDGLAKTFQCIARLGSGGCGFEAPLEAVKRALDKSRAENDGFLRTGAFLVVVFLVDEDDASLADPRAFFSVPGVLDRGDFRAQPLIAYQCNRPIDPNNPGSYTDCAVRTDSLLTDPQSYSGFLSRLKPPGRTVVAVIGGDPEPNIATGTVPAPIDQPLGLMPSCTVTVPDGSDSGSEPDVVHGRPALRMASFLDPFGDHGLFATVCQADYSQTLDDIGELLIKVVSPCLEGEIDTLDPDPAPGAQIDCNVSDVQLEPVLVETGVPACPMEDDTTPRAGGPRPCWWVAPNPTACASTESKLELHVERTTPPPIGTDVRVRCASKNG